MKIYIPLLDKVLVKRHVAVNEKSGFILPQSEVQETQSGEVIRAAEGTGFEEGQEVVFDKFSNPMKIKEGDQELIILSTKDIFGILKEDGRNS